MAEARKAWLGAPTKARHGDSNNLTVDRISSLPCRIPDRGSNEKANVKRTEVEFKDKRGTLLPFTKAAAEEEDEADDAAALDAAAAAAGRFLLS